MKFMMKNNKMEQHLSFKCKFNHYYLLIATNFNQTYMSEFSNSLPSRIPPSATDSVTPTDLTF